MKKITSTAISPGLASAELKIIKTSDAPTKTEEFTTAENEWRLFKKAQKQAVFELNELALKAQNDAGKDFSALFETHALMAEDPDFEDAVKDGIDMSSLSARSAVLEAGNSLALIFESMDDEYMRQRSADIKDVAQRIASVICGDKGNIFDFNSPVIIAADDLTPSQTITLDKDLVKGFILFKGTKNGHTGILARNLGIPAVINPVERFLDTDDAKTVLLDGTTGEIILEPDRKTKAEFQERIKNAVLTQKELNKYKNVQTKTTNGKSIKLYCNIGNPKDVDDVLENTGEGIGLFRSEFLYLGTDDYPD
ncbi:MAG: PEP-utilizing enzyme, partial [Clostridia bacterium]|nr:PEP-utilizing enzyme [Clostridia bacterium]